MLDIYKTAQGLDFRLGEATMGFIPYQTLKLTQAAGVTPEDALDMQYVAEELQPGEVFKVGDFNVVLGPQRKFTHEVDLHAVGNPDHQQYADIGPKKTVKVVGIKEAVAAVMTYQDYYQMGAGNCDPKHGVVYKIPRDGAGERRKVGEVYYNGRYRTNAQITAVKAEIRRKYPNPSKTP